MKLQSVILLLVTTIGLTAADLDWQAQFQARINYTNTESQVGNTLLRSRLAFQVREGKLSGMVQVQDSRILGADRSNSGELRPDSTWLGLHQVYLSIDQLYAPGWEFQLGRFELNLGNQRLFSPNKWNNYGRSFDGLRLRRSGNRPVTGEIFYLKVFESLETTGDTDINGIYLYPVAQNQIPLGLNSLEIYGFQELNTDTTARRINRTTFGSRIELSFMFLKLEAEAGRQTGSSAGDNDIAAWFMVTNLTIKTGLVPFLKKITIGQEHFSGDDTSSNTVEGFANPYGAGHRFHGYFDEHKFFKDNFHRGLREWNVKINLEFRPGSLTRINYHNFRTGDGSNTLLGQEWDFELVYKVSQAGAITMGYSNYKYGIDSAMQGSASKAYTVFSFVF